MTKHDNKLSQQFKSSYHSITSEVNTKTFSGFLDNFKISNAILMENENNIK